MTQNQSVPRAYEVIPLLATEWRQSREETMNKFRQFIKYHEYHKHHVAACLYRCAFAQLLRGFDVENLNGLGMTEEEMKNVTGT